MTAKEFLEGKTLNAIELIDDIVLNLVVEQSVFGLNVDTSGIQAGRYLTRTEDFVIENDVLKTEEIELNLSTTNMLGNFSNEE